jgi:hypothetical protein
MRILKYLGGPGMDVLRATPPLIDLALSRAESAIWPA